MKHGKLCANMTPITVYAAERQELYATRRGGDVEVRDAKQKGSRVDHATEKMCEMGRLAFRAFAGLFAP